MDEEQEYLPGVTGRMVESPGIGTFMLESGDPAGVPVVFVHGNVASNRFWEDTLAALPNDFYGIAPDLRGFGRSQALPVDATRGLRDFSDDLFSLIETSGLGAIHLVGWSLGGGVAMQIAIDHPDAVRSPVSRRAGAREIYVDAMLATHVGPDNYPGGMTPSQNWPGVAPGPTGVNNALSPKWLNLSGFAEIGRSDPPG